MTREQERANAVCQLLSMPDEECLAGRRTTGPIVGVGRAGMKTELARAWLEHRIFDAKDESSAKIRLRPRLTLNRRRA